MWSSARFRLPQAEGARPVRLTQGPQRACVRSSLGPSLGRLIPTRTSRSTHIMPRSWAFISLHIHPAPLHVDPTHAAGRASEAILAALGGRSMHDRAFELPRISLPRTSMNKGINKGRGVAAPALVRAGNAPICTPYFFDGPTVVNAQV